MGTQGGIDHRQVGLGSSHKEVDCQIVVTAGFAYFLPGGSAIIILAVALSLLHIGFHKGIQNALVAALGVVVVKIQHNLPPDSFS